MKLLIAMMISLLGMNAFAYVDGTFSCKNVEGLPNNTYEIKTDANGIPAVTSTRYFRYDENSPVLKTVLKGYALVAANSEGVDALVLGGVTLDFDGDKLVNCK